MALLLTMAVATFPACGDDSSDRSIHQRIETVHGLIKEVEAVSLFGLDLLVLEDENGTQWKFNAQGKMLRGFTLCI